MYCKKCGNQIEDDAQFCKFCGEYVGTGADVVRGRNIVEWFQNKSRNSRLIIIIGLVWLFIGICFLFECEYSEDYLTLFAIFVGAPLIVWSVWYYFKYLRKERKEKPAVDMDKHKEENTEAINEKQSDLIPLLDFAKENGKMQVGKYAYGDSGIIKARCVFTKSIYVDFSPELGELTAEEISLKKENLFVKIIDKQTFLLVGQE